MEAYYGGSGSAKPSLHPPPATAAPEFVRGDATDDGILDIADAMFTLFALFGQGDVAPGCWKALDTDDDVATTITDAVRSLLFLILSGAQPGPPFPACGQQT